MECECETVPKLSSDTISNDLEWLSEIFNDTKYGARAELLVIVLPNQTVCTPYCHRTLAWFSALCRLSLVWESPAEVSCTDAMDFIHCRHCVEVRGWTCAEAAEGKFMKCGCRCNTRQSVYSRPADVLWCSGWYWVLQCTELLTEARRLRADWRTASRTLATLQQVALPHR